ncbi:hypothetical protein F511_29941 [Dorcoceras hygrometricum]|uniref:Uncharacterized protein n=1 Tax=Dorcoceras hygrometricum TaxID=472368 RepID=A0A2Z7AE38_9LAMI|nr:hypothetical protein F511_29941 [Dorcoceras hygrometricum]
MLYASAATEFPNDWLDQTMSYQLIQTTSFAMHPRLVDYITVALVWMHCSCLLVILRRRTCWFSSLQRASAESLARRQNAVVSTYVNYIVLLSLTPSTICWLHCSSLLIDLPVRRRFSLASGSSIDWFHCSFSSLQRESAESLARRQNSVVSTYVNVIVLLSLTPSTICWLHCSSLLIDLPVRRRFSLASGSYIDCFLFASTPACAPADLSSSADCDDITADVIIADSDLCASSQLLIVMTSSLLLIASSRIYADVITADTRFLFASIQQLISSTSEHCSLLLKCSSSILLQ